MPQIECDEEFKKWLAQFTSDINASFPQGYKLSQKAATKILPKMISNKTVTINMVLEAPLKGHPYNGNHSKIKEYQEFLV